jgi:pentatricopeptide repeat protein
MWRRALDLLDEMRENGIAPNDITYSVVIAACGNGGQWERALELLYQVRFPLLIPIIY